MSAASGASGGGDSREDRGLLRAAMARVDAPEDRLEVRVNPGGYKLLRRAPGRGDLVPADRREEFSTEIFIDSTDLAGPDRDARRAAVTLRRWMDPLPGRLHPPKVLFAWGTFRFAGAIEAVEEEWIRFDPDGTPVRGRLRIVLRS